MAFWRCQKLETEMFQAIPPTPCPTFLFLCAKAKKKKLIYLITDITVKECQVYITAQM